MLAVAASMNTSRLQAAQQCRTAPRPDNRLRVVPAAPLQRALSFNDVRKWAVFHLIDSRPCLCCQWLTLPQGLRAIHTGLCVQRQRFSLSRKSMSAITYEAPCTCFGKPRLICRACVRTSLVQLALFDRLKWVCPSMLTK